MPNDLILKEKKTGRHVNFFIFFPSDELFSFFLKENVSFSSSVNISSSSLSKEKKEKSEAFNALKCDAVISFM